MHSTRRGTGTSLPRRGLLRRDKRERPEWTPPTYVPLRRSSHSLKKPNYHQHLQEVIQDLLFRGFKRVDIEDLVEEVLHHVGVNAQHPTRVRRYIDAAITRECTAGNLSHENTTITITDPTETIFSKVQESVDNEFTMMNLLYENKHTYNVLSRIEDQLEHVDVAAPTTQSGPSGVTTTRIQTTNGSPIPGEDEKPSSSAEGAQSDEQSIMHFDGFRVSLIHDKITSLLDEAEYSRRKREELTDMWQDTLVELQEYRHAVWAGAPDPRGYHMVPRVNASVQTTFE